MILAPPFYDDKGHGNESPKEVSKAEKKLWTLGGCDAVKIVDDSESMIGENKCSLVSKWHIPTYPNRIDFLFLPSSLVGVQYSQGLPPNKTRTELKSTSSIITGDGLVFVLSHTSAECDSVFSARVKMC